MAPKKEKKKKKVANVNEYMGWDSQANITSGLQ